MIANRKMFIEYHMVVNSENLGTSFKSHFNVG